MWASTSSSPMCETGAINAAAISASPVAKAAARQIGGGEPAAASERARNA